MGTAILLRRNLQNMQVKHIEISQPSLQNRVTHLQIISNDVLHLINVYCPADHYDKDPFFKDFNIYLENLECEKIILAGNFNFVENVEDRFPKLNKNDKKVRKIFNPKNPSLFDPIYKSKTMKFTCKNARLDRFYISDFMLGYVKKSATLSEVAGHKLVLLDLDLEDLKLWGKFYWKMNNHYSGDNFYKREIQIFFFKILRNGNHIHIFWIIGKCLN